MKDGLHMQLEDTLLFGFYGTAIVALIAYTVQAVQAILHRRRSSAPAQPTVVRWLEGIVKHITSNTREQAATQLELHARLGNEMYSVLTKFIDERLSKIMDATQQILDEIAALSSRDDQLFVILNSQSASIIELKGELAAALASGNTVDQQKIHDALDALITRTSAAISAVTPPTGDTGNANPGVAPPVTTQPPPSTPTPAPATDATPADATPVDVNASTPTSTPTP